MKSTTTSSNMEIVDIQSMDVLCGRGKNSFNHGKLLKNPPSKLHLNKQFIPVSHKFPSSFLFSYSWQPQIP